jgi:hypothetical protein
MVEMLMNDERVWEDIPTQHLQAGTEENDEITVRIDVVQAEIRTEHN